MPPRLREKITQTPTEIDPSTGISGLHAIAFDLKREADVTKEEVGCDGNQQDPEEEPLG
jgi:hypothetical protein